MASNLCPLHEHNASYGFSKLQVTILASEWGSSKGGLSTINRELAIQLAKFSCIEVTFFLPKCSDKDKKAGASHGISILEAKRRPGFDELELLCFPPQNLRIDVVIGHGVKLGRQAQVIRDSHKCKWVQVVHSDPEELGMFKCYENPISRGEEKHHIEVELCQLADFVVGVGPKLAEAFCKYLSFCKKCKDVFQFTPGIFEEFSSVEQVPDERKECSVLVFGRGDAEDFKLKGFDIAAKSVAALSYTVLVFVGAPDRKHEEIAERFVDFGIPEKRLRVKGYMNSREALKQLFCQVDLALMPSRTEGFGLTGLEALSAGLPVIISKNSGFGEALGSLPSGSFFVIDSEDDSAWIAAIKDVWNKDRKARLDEFKALRGSYGERYSWSKQCKSLIEKMVKLVHGDCEALFKGQSSQPETVKSFGNSGVIVHFNDYESLPLEVQEVRSEIRWDEAFTINLLSDDEVQLSPVVEFQPHGSRLSNPVCVRIPHSALVDSSHGWSIGLKSSVLSEGAVVWKDKGVDRIQCNEVSFYMNCLLSYVVVGTPAGNSDPAKKRFYCLVFGGQGKVGSNYSVYLYVVDECDTSLEKLIQDEKSRKRILLSSVHSLQVESVHETDVKVAVKQLSSSWKIASKNPCVISHKSLRQSFQTFPCAEIIFAHDNGQNGQFRCTFELTAGDATSQICVRTSIEEDPFGNYKDSGMHWRHQIVTRQGACAGNSDPAKKRFYCLVFGGQGKVGPNYSVYFYVIDGCDASLKKLIQDEKSRKRILLSSVHSLQVESVHETDVKVAVKQLSSSWKIASKNPCVISHKSLRQSFQTFPCAEIIFAHDNGQNGQFRCTFELTAGDAISQICVRTSIEEDPFGNYKASGMRWRHQMVTGHDAHASKPLLSLVNDYSKLVEDIYEHLDTPIQGAGHYEGIAKYFGYSIFTIKSKFERSYGSPSRAMIEALTAWQPKLTVESFAVVVEKQAGRNDVAVLLRKYDQNHVVTKQVSKPLKDLVNDPSDYLDKICKRLDMPITGVGNYKKVAKYYNFDMYTIYYFEESPGGPSEALISAITAKYPELTVSMFARAVAKQTSRWDVVDLLMDFDRK
ncbi:uncharacterized protein LOC141879978 isoform X2 [Acropora palmata]|uniref:uncharacterized protein LOC141879978 isoform X2 n=1 Tax=Acropora palmata TaxID=6131 RepID=UPI003D9FEAE7